MRDVNAADRPPIQRPGLGFVIAEEADREPGDIGVVTKLEPLWVGLDRMRRGLARIAEGGAVHACPA